ncbi:hypothetical protein [Synechococcus sp. PCC 7502]|uniref:hypothetical protein n=1 Tax=Synechococcus sp. PCC 7502 TaxID=1173263 RepID=UPI0002DBEC98|nr:hypothetical protein [Synechococcus sp. PCC 7502]
MQDSVAEHLKTYIDELQDETKWNKSFQRTQSGLIAAAKKAKQEIAAGKATTMNYESNVLPSFWAEYQN